MKTLLLVFTVVLSMTLTLCFAAPSHAQSGGPVIDIYVPDKIVHQVAMPVFSSATGGPRVLPKQVTDAIQKDLEFTGLFSVIDRGASLEKPGAVSLSGSGTKWDDWSILKASLLVRGELSVRGNDVQIDVRAFHVTSRRSIGARRVRGRSESMEQVIHAASDALYELLTGQEGFFTSQIAYVNNRTGNKELYVAEFNGTGERAITRNRSINLSPAWSSDGKQIAFTSYVRGNPDLFLYKTKSGKFFRLSNRPGLNIGAAFAPRGRVLAATLSVRRGNPDIYLINDDGSGPRRVTRSFANDVSPTWSPDSRELAFVSDRAGNPNIYVVNPTGGKPKRITFKHKDNQSPTWSPRGDRIAFAGRISGKWQIMTMASDGSGLTQVTSGRYNSEDPTWSPDGRMILYSSNRSGRRHLWVMEADGSNPRQLTQGRGEYTNPSWGPRR